MPTGIILYSPTCFYMINQKTAEKMTSHTNWREMEKVRTNSESQRIKGLVTGLNWSCNLSCTVGGHLQDPVDTAHTHTVWHAVTFILTDARKQSQQCFNLFMFFSWPTSSGPGYSSPSLWLQQPSVSFITVHPCMFSRNFSFSLPVSLTSNTSCHLQCIPQHV